LAALSYHSEKRDQYQTSVQRSGFVVEHWQHIARKRQLNPARHRDRLAILPVDGHRITTGQLFEDPFIGFARLAKVATNIRDLAQETLEAEGVAELIKAHLGGVLAA
jgi:hypothetical protein